MSTAVAYNGRIYIMGYLGEGPDLSEGVACFDANTGQKLWQKLYLDFLSDTIYTRYSTSSPTIDPETGNVYIQDTQGIFAGFTRGWQNALGTFVDGGIRPADLSQRPHRLAGGGSAIWSSRAASPPIGARKARRRTAFMLLTKRRASMSGPRLRARGPRTIPIPTRCWPGWTADGFFTPRRAMARWFASTRERANRFSAFRFSRRASTPSLLVAQQRRDHRHLRNAL